jgi:hypothetical protein
MTIGERILKISKIALMIWGAISLIGIIIIALLFFYPEGLGSGNEIVTDKATKEDVKFILNWCELGDERIEKVLKSSVSPRSFTGDHLDAYSIKISHIDISELKQKEDMRAGQWYRGDSLPKILDDAIEFIGGFQHETPWFPTEKNIRTSDYYIYPWSIYCHGVIPRSAQIIIVKPTEKIVYYISVSI